MTLGPHWWKQSAIPPYQLPLYDHSLEKFSNSHMNMNDYFFSPENIMRSVMGKLRPR